MSDHRHIEELRRRVKADPASVAFAALAEEYRRAGRYEEAIETCRAGLAHHPYYLSARVTLGRSLIEVNELQLSRLELEQVLYMAPGNLPAICGLAEIQRRRGHLDAALELCRRALESTQKELPSRGSGKLSGGEDTFARAARVSADFSPDHGRLPGAGGTGRVPRVSSPAATVAEGHWPGSHRILDELGQFLAAVVRTRRQRRGR